MNNLNKMLEHFWLIFTFASLVYAGYQVYLVGWDQGGKNFIVPPIAFCWWLLRRFMRKRIENSRSSTE